MRRIALYTDSLTAGGAERVFLYFSDFLLQRGYAVDFVVNNFRGPNVDFLSPEVRVVDLRPANWLGAVRELEKYFKKDKPDLMLATLPHCNLISVTALFLSGVDTKLVLREANAIKQFMKYYRKARYRRLKWLVPVLYPMADKLIANSSFSVCELADMAGFAEDKVGVLYNPLPAKMIREKAEENINHPWFVSEGQPVLIAIGSLDVQKDFSTLIQAVAELKEYREAKCIILGEGPCRAHLQELIRSLGLQDTVELAGYKNNPYPYLKRADVLVSSSRWEGLPNVLLEALALKVPVVATDCPGGSSEILDAGKYGKLVKKQNPSALAGAINKTLNSSKKKINYEQAVARFEPEKVGNALIELIEDLVD